MSIELPVAGADDPRRIECSFYFEPTKSTHPKIGKFASIGGYSDICEPRKARKIPVNYGEMNHPTYPKTGAVCPLGSLNTAAPSRQRRVVFGELCGPFWDDSVEKAHTIGQVLPPSAQTDNRFGDPAFLVIAGAHCANADVMRHVVSQPRLQ
jgi:hypothetical protein